MSKSGKYRASRSSRGKINLKSELTDLKSEKSFSENIVITKGNDNLDPINIDINDITERLNRLRKISDKSLRNLSTSEASDFRKMIQYTQLLFDTDEYRMYYQKVLSIFGDLNTVTPGTVGAYFVGCSIPNGTKDVPGCSVVCAGSIPPPRGSEINGKPFKRCDYSVFWLTRDGDKYNLTTLYETSNHENVIVYVDSNSIIGNSFTGFSEDEKERLSNYGCRNVNVIKYSEDGKEYRQLLPNGFVEISQAPSRIDIIENETSPKTNKGAVIILLIILLLIVTFVGWKMLQ
jgi:hypothetical protein